MGVATDHPGMGEHPLELQLELDDIDDFRGRLRHRDGWERSFRGKLSLLAALEDVGDLGSGPDP